jgi:hypothetical protein
LALGLAAQTFVHQSGKTLVTGDGQPLMLRGINLGNWLVPEGYMFRFEHGPQSAREIDALSLAGDDPLRILPAAVLEKGKVRECTSCLRALPPL